MGLHDATISFTVPDDGDDYRDAIPVPAERLPLDVIIDFYHAQEQTTPDAAARAAALLLSQIGERSGTHVITGADCAYALAAGSSLDDDAATTPENLWDAAADAEHRIREHYPWADMMDHLVLPYDTRAEEIAILCGECSAYLSNAERPDDDAYTALLDDFDRDIHADEQAPYAPRLRMHYGTIEAEHTEGQCAVCERDLFDSPDDGRAHVWAY